MFFAVAPGAASVFRQELEGLQIRSKRVRRAAEHAILDRSGRAVRIIEVQGICFSPPPRDWCIA
jgi:hypothetical protein